MRRLLASFVAILLLGMLAAPVQAGAPASIDRMYFGFDFETADYEYVQVHSDFYEDGHWSFGVYAREGQSYYSPRWSCYANGHDFELFPFPEWNLKGKDVLQVTAEFLSEDFEDCYVRYGGVVPETIAFDLTGEAEFVVKDDGTRHVIKGEGSEYKTQRYYASHVTVIGVFDVAEVLPEEYPNRGYWSTLKLL